jgi:hypothetical protein
VPPSLTVPLPAAITVPRCGFSFGGARDNDSAAVLLTLFVRSRCTANRSVRRSEATLLVDDDLIQRVVVEREGDLSHRIGQRVSGIDVRRAPFQLGSYSECDARCSASHCSLIQPRLAELRPPGTRMRGMMPTAINTMATPTMNSIWFSPHLGRRITILTRGKMTICALVHTASGT